MCMYKTCLWEQAVDMKKSKNEKNYISPEIEIEYLDTHSPLMTSIDDTTNTRDNDNPDPFDQKFRRFLHWKFWK